MLFRFWHSNRTSVKMGCRKGSRLGSERMAVGIRETKSKTWAVFYLRRASLRGNCDNARERGRGRKYAA